MRRETPNLCLANSRPSLSNTQHVLYKLLWLRSEMEPPTKVTPVSFATSERALTEGLSPPSMSSAYTGKLGQFVGQKRHQIRE
jgi:hypothetical protein